MDFFNSLSQVAKNRNNFKQWENKQHNEEAQREELARRRQYTPEQLQQAKEFGSTVIDVIDVMDNHSESVAENVETAVDPLSSIATMVTFFGGNWLVGTKSTQKLSNKIGKIKNDFYESDKYRQLKERVSKYCSEKGVDEPWNILDKKSIKKIKDAELRKDLSLMKKQLDKGVWKYRKQIFRNHGLVGLATVGMYILSTIYEAKLQTDSSKIARYQARKVLDDPKELVTYTPEQIAKAKQELADHPELLKKEKKAKLKTGFFSSIFNIIKDNRAYRKDKKVREDNSQKVTRPLTKEELIQAEKDKEVIQRTVRIINNEAEKNSENMEAAANVILNTTPILGATVGAATGWILDKFNVFDKFVSDTIEKEGNENSKKLYEELKNSKKTGLAYFKQWNEFKESMYSDNSIRASINDKSKLKKADFEKSVKKLFAVGFAHKSGKTKILGVVASVVTGFAGAMFALKLQKSAARAGRYAAKRELEKHPENFIGYSQEQYDEVKDVQNKNKKPNKFKEYALFIPNVMKQYWDYNKYKKHEFKEKQALKDLLKKQDISDEQLKNAKNLQRKLFNTFEKVDDNSQVYSESMEAATEIAQPFVQYTGMLLAFSPVIYTGVQVARGKITPAKLLDKITSKLSSSSNIMKKKWFKKYLDNVEKNITNTVNNVDIKQTIWSRSGENTIEMKPVKAILEGIDLQKDPITKVFSKVLENTNMSLEKFKKLSDEEQTNYLFLLRNRARATVDKIPNFDTNKIENFFEVMINGRNHKVKISEYIQMTPQLRADVMDLILNPKNIPTPERFEQAHKILTRATSEEFANTVTIFSPKLDEIKALLSSADFKAKFANIEAKIRELAKKSDGNFPLSTGMIKYGKKILGEEKFNECFGQLSRKGIDNFVDSSKKTIAKPKDIAKVVGVQPDEAIKLFEAISLKVKTATFKDAFNLLPEKFTNPKKVLTTFKSSIEKMTPEKFEEFADFKLHMSSMDKDTLLRIIPKIEKIFDNLPKEELDKITSKLMQEFNERPDEVIKLVSSGKIANIFITPQLKNALTVAGITWAAFSVAVTIVVEAWLANIQLKAGRLGVMKAMEALDDPAYYANIESTVQEKQIQSKETNKISSSPSTNLLDKLKKN